MPIKELAQQTLLDENAQLRARLEEAEETIRAIRSGEVDALVVGTQLYTLESADAASNRFRGNVLDQINDAVIAVDDEYRVTYFNAAAERLYDVAASAVLGCPLEEVYRERWLGENDEDTADAMLRTSGYWRGENIHIKKSGEEIYVETSVSRLLHSNGTSGILAVIRDSTARKRAEQSLLDISMTQQRSARELRSLANNLPELVARFDADHRYLFVNKAVASATGIDVRAFHGHTNGELGIIPALCALWDDHLTLVFRSETESKFEFEYETPAGRRTFYTYLIPEKDLIGSVVSCLCVGHDITERKRAEAAAHETSRRKDEFLATLAHELRNPLAPIRNAIEIMRLSPVREVRIQARNMIERQLTQMVRLVDDLLDVSRITLGRVELRKQRTYLATVIQNAVETSRPLIEASSHELTVNLPASPVVVDADSTRLAQVFVNLLNNAAKYTPANGRIILTAVTEGSDVCISVRDTGIGIPQEMLPLVFELFTQVDRALDRAQGGLGIGLTLVKRLVEMHGGTVEARSEGEGRGSEFVVRLPLVATATTPTFQAAQDADPDGGPGNRCRVLVVDDNRDANDSLTALLRLQGHITAAAYDGLEAISATEHFHPEAILLDIGLPKLNGYEAARQIRKQPGGERLMLIALTGWGQEEDRRRSRDAGFDHHLVKPADPLELERILAPLRRNSVAHP